MAGDLTQEIYPSGRAALNGYDTGRAAVQPIGDNPGAAGAAVRLRGQWGDGGRRWTAPRPVRGAGSNPEHSARRHANGNLELTVSWALFCNEPLN